MKVFKLASTVALTWLALLGNVGTAFADTSPNTPVAIGTFSCNTHTGRQVHDYIWTIQGQAQAYLNAGLLAPQNASTTLSQVFTYETRVFGTTQFSLLKQALPGDTVINCIYGR